MLDMLGFSRLALRAASIIWVRQRIEKQDHTAG